MITPLKAAGLLHATRGAQGGYVLAREPGEITLRDIVGILEGPVSVVACVSEPGTCARSASCTAREAWTEVENAVNNSMSGITLKELVRRHKERESISGPSYMI